MSKTRIFLVGLATLVAIYITGSVITELTNNLPFRSIQRVIEDVRWPLTLTENLINLKVRDTFSNKVGKTKFGENNVTRITPEVVKTDKLLGPEIKVDNTGAVIVTTLLPGIFTSTITDTQIINESRESYGGIPYARKIFIMQESYQLTIPKGMHYAIFKEDTGTNRNPDLVYTIVAFYYDPVNNVSFHSSYESTGFVPGDGQKPFDRDIYNKLYNVDRGGKWEDLPLSDGITPVAKPAFSDQELHMFLFVRSGSLVPHSSFDDTLAKSREAIWEYFVDSNQKLFVLSSQ